MTAQFQKNNLIILLILMIFFTYQTHGQTNDKCNRSVDIKEYEKDLIKEVCIPKGYVIYNIQTKYVDIDTNGDSLPDFIFNWEKKNIKEGDSLFISIYKMKPDSTYAFLKTFNNLMPINLKSYSEPSRDPYYEKFFWDCYHNAYPLRDLKFENGNITLNMRTEAVAGLIFDYKYSKQKNNWILQSIKKYVDIPNKDRRYEPYPFPEKEETIDDFSYEKYLCPERLEK